MDNTKWNGIVCDPGPTMKHYWINVFQLLNAGLLKGCRNGVAYNKRPILPGQESNE